MRMSPISPTYDRYDKMVTAWASSQDGASGEALGATGAGDASTSDEVQTTAGAGQMTSAGSVGGSGSSTQVVHSRADGIVMEFSSRSAKQEALRQQALERAYEAEQARWGLPTAACTAQGAPLPHPSAAAGHGAGSAADSDDEGHRLVARGRGRQTIRPAWLTRIESASAAKP